MLRCENEWGDEKGVINKEGIAPLTCKKIVISSTKKKPCLKLSFENLYLQIIYPYFIDYVDAVKDKVI